MDLLLKKPKSFECQVSLLFFVLNDEKLWSHIDQISKHINYPDQKIHSYDQTIKIIVNSDSKKVENNDNYSTQLTRLYNSSLTSIVETTEKNLWNVDKIYGMRKVHTSSVKS